MDESYVIAISFRALYLILLISAPSLMSALFVGLIISVLQATTQIQEQSLSFVPKLIVTFAVLIITGPWAMTMTKDFMAYIYTEITRIPILK